MPNPRPLAALLLLGSILCTPAIAADERLPFVRVSPRDSRYFETTDGKPYIPIGLNIISAPGDRQDDPEQRLAGLDQRLTKLAANGGNHFRAWLGNEFYQVETEQAGQYDPAKATRIDTMLALARKHGLRVKMTIEHFRDIDPANPGRPWTMNTLHHTSRGGLADSMKEWVESPAARTQFVGKMEFFAARYGNDPTIYGWELWNEMNSIRPGCDFIGWTAAMLPEMHRLFPRHLCMQSLGSFDWAPKRDWYRQLTTMPGNDVAQVHRYLDRGAALEICHGPVDVLAADAVRELLGYEPGRPVMLAESGAVEPRHSASFKLYAKDKAGSILHDVLFAPFFAGAAGVGQIWHWNDYVDPHDLWWHFGRFAAAVHDLDPPAENFQPVMIDHPSLRVYLLEGNRTLLAWCRDKANDWSSELADGNPPQTLRDMTIELDQHATGFDGARVRIYDPWTDRWSDGVIRDGAVALPQFQRSIVIRIER